MRGIMPVMNRRPINADHDDHHYEELLEGQTKDNKICDTLNIRFLFL